MKFSIACVCICFFLCVFIICTMCVLCMNIHVWKLVQVCNAALPWGGSKTPAEVSLHFPPCLSWSLCCWLLHMPGLAGP